MSGPIIIPDDRSTSLLAVDPGKDTGYIESIWRPGPRNVTTLPAGAIEPVRYTEAPQDDFLDWAEEVITGGFIDVVICEGYDITMATLRKDRGEAWSIEQRGVLRHLARRQGIPFIVQRPMAVLPLVTDDRLKPFGLNKRGGKGHWRDAARHLVYFLAKQGKVELEV